MVEQVPQGAVGVGVADLDGLPADLFGGEVRLTAADLADCPDQDEELQRILAGDQPSSALLSSSPNSDMRKVFMFRSIWGNTPEFAS